MDEKELKSLAKEYYVRENISPFDACLKAFNQLKYKNIEYSANKQFQNLIEKILVHGKRVNTRNSEVKRIMNYTMEFTKTPLITLRKTFWKGALREFEWFLSGSNELSDLHDSVKHWWEPFSKDGISLPYNYSIAFRDETDQIDRLIEGIKEHPNSRRNIVTTWIPNHVYSGLMNPTNCHGTIIQTWVDDQKLNMTMVQRSCDVLLGLPHNLIQYWAFLMWLAGITNYKVGKFVWIGLDCHIYNDHLEMAKKIVQYKKDIDNTPNLLCIENKNVFEANNFRLSGKPKWIFKEKLNMIV